MTTTHERIITELYDTLAGALQRGDAVDGYQLADQAVALDAHSMAVLHDTVARTRDVIKAENAQAWLNAQLAEKALHVTRRLVDAMTTDERVSITLIDGLAQPDRSFPKAVVVGEVAIISRLTVEMIEGATVVRAGAAGVPVEEVYPHGFPLASIWSVDTHRADYVESAEVPMGEERARSLILANIDRDGEVEVRYLRVPNGIVPNGIVTSAGRITCLQDADAVAPAALHLTLRGYRDARAIPLSLIVSLEPVETSRVGDRPADHRQLLLDAIEGQSSEWFKVSWSDGVTARTAVLRPFGFDGDTVCFDCRRDADARRELVPLAEITGVEPSSVGWA